MVSFQKDYKVFVTPFGAGVDEVAIRCCPCFVNHRFRVESSAVRL